MSDFTVTSNAPPSKVKHHDPEMLRLSFLCHRRVQGSMQLRKHQMLKLIYSIGLLFQRDAIIRIAPDAWSHFCLEADRKVCYSYFSLCYLLNLLHSYGRKRNGITFFLCFIWQRTLFEMPVWLSFKIPKLNKSRGVLIY